MNEYFEPLHLIFYLFSAIAVCAAVTVISVRNPVHSVLALVVTFFAMAGNWMLLRAEFLSLILILVYVGAVMTLFLFVVMMLNIDKEQVRRGLVRYYPFGILIALLLFALLMVAIWPSKFVQVPAPASEAANYSNVYHLGELLFNRFAYPFEIAGVILLAAIIAAITLTHRGAVRKRTQQIAEQISVNPADRVRLVKMPVEVRTALNPDGDSKLTSSTNSILKQGL